MRGRPPQRHPRNNQGGGNPQQVGQEGEGRQVRNPEENIGKDLLNKNYLINFKN